jgi:uncharacterized membrane protein YjjP (DUF1212 family)
MLKVLIYGRNHQQIKRINGCYKLIARRGAMVHPNVREIMSIAMLAGEILLRNGAETYRVEETIEHIGRACGATRVEAFVIPTGIIVTIQTEQEELSRCSRIKERTINLSRITKVNELSRRLREQRITPEQARILLERIAQERTGFNLGTLIGSSGLVGASYAIMQEASVMETIPAFLAAMLVRYIAHVVSRLHMVRFLFEFFGAASAALIGIAAQALMPEINRDIVIVGALMPLVPGMAITNSIRDIIAGDLLAGVSRALEAMLTATAIAMGVVLVLATGLGG